MYMYINRHRSLCTLCDAIGILVCTNKQDIFNSFFLPFVVTVKYSVIKNQIMFSFDMHIYS